VKAVSRKDGADGREQVEGSFAKIIGSGAGRRN
jgi:hypothetical protein